MNLVASSIHKETDTLHPLHPLYTLYPLTR
jgi:hypothetical protein